MCSYSTECMVGNALDRLFKTFLRWHAPKLPYILLCAIQCAYAVLRCPQNPGHVHYIHCNEYSGHVMNLLILLSAVHISALILKLPGK